MGFGWGNQIMMVFPEQNLIAVFTGWELLHEEANAGLLTNRLLPAMTAATCTGNVQRK